jgi:protein-S-isoprenylcysteine O-methyltransferase Ste14
MRDEEKCLAKYGEGYEAYMRLVRYHIVPYMY